MFWGLIFVRFIFIFVGVFSGGFLASWKGFLWLGLRLREGLGFLGSTLVLVVGVVVFHALLFSSFYMSREKRIRSFLLVTILFVRSIIILIGRDSLLALFLGWDGLGVSSFFLVVWYQSWVSWDRGMVTFLSNRLGDFFLIFRLIRYLSLGWVRERRARNFGFSFLFILACFTKRAQAPLIVWLPIAIRAPTPIRALVHSRTLVTAGLLIALKLRRFLLAKTFFVLGALTMLIAGGVRLFEIDLKKVVALSTLRQLGFMGVGLGAGILTLVLFHIIRHAFIKRALFILVGVLLHINFGAQDKRLMRVFSKSERFCLRGLIVCSFSLCGLGFTRGFVRKEALLLQQRAFQGRAPALLGFFLVVSLTLIYCGRLLMVGVQNIFCRRGRAERRTKIIRRSALLLFLRVRRAWSLRDRLLFIAQVRRSWEKLIPLLMMGLAFFIWKMTPQWKLIFRGFGWNLRFSQRAKRLFNIRKKDREVVDQRNWRRIKWLDYAWALAEGRRKRIYLIFYFILISVFLL